MRNLAVSLVVVGWSASAFAEPSRIGGLAVDLPAFLSRNDVVYLAPPREGWQGLPLGNGRLGAVQWQPDDVLLELNSSLSGVYGGAIGRVRLKTTPGILAGVQSYTQRLAPGEATVSTAATYPHGRFTAKTFIAADADVLVFDVEDTRPGAVHQLEIEAWRKTASVRIEDGVLVLSDKLSTAGEPDYRFALAVAIDAKTAATPRGTGSLETAGGRYTAYVAFADTRDPKIGVVAEAQARLAAVRQRGLEAVCQSHRQWWQRFWSRSLVHLTSADGVADYLESCWVVHLYAMGAGSRGEVPPKFNGGLWIHNHDQREWGTSYWHWNQQEATWPIFAAGQLELHRPYQNLYWGMLPEVKKWTKEMYGLEGAQIQETIPFHGRMPHWPTVRGVHPRVPVPEKFAHTNAILSTSAEVAMQFWWYWLYSGDETFLRERAYPLMREVTLFYLGYLEKDAGGRYVIWPSNSHESFWRVKNPTPDLAGIRYLFPRVIQAAERLQCDEDLRARCRDALEHLAPYPIDAATGSLMPYELQPGEKMQWRNAENTRLFPIGVFPLMTPGTPDYPLALKSFLARKNVCVYGWNTDAICAARLGIADGAAARRLFPGSKPQDARARGLDYLLPLHVARYQNYPCGLMDYYTRKPGMHFYLEGSGTLATAINEMLLQGWDGLIRVAPALPAAWDARFTLLAPGGFLVTAECHGGRVEHVSIQSRRGGRVRLANPFGEPVLVRSGEDAVAAGDQPVVEFQTTAGGTYVVVPKSHPDAARDRPVLTGKPASAPKRLGGRWLGIPVSTPPKEGSG